MGGGRGHRVGRLYFPSDVRDRLICWAHTSPSSGHPGIGRTVRCLSGKYWWPTVAKDVRVYVSSCSVCAQFKAPRHLPRGKLQPLPVPQRPWSHLSVDFVTDLPPSQGNTTILVVVDRFSKSCRLLPLPGLPMALQTVEALFTHVFRHYGVPEDIGSDRGPQFTSRVWKAFMELLGVSISLTSGFHPKSNGQVGRVNQDVGPIARTARGSGRRSCPGPRWHRTHIATPPLTSLPSSAYWGTSRFWHLGIRVRPRFLRWTTGSGARR